MKKKNLKWSTFAEALEMNKTAMVVSPTNTKFPPGSLQALVKRSSTLATDFVVGTWTTYDEPARITLCKYRSPQADRYDYALDSAEVPTDPVTGERRSFEIIEFVEVQT